MTPRMGSQMRDDKEWICWHVSTPCFLTWRARHSFDNSSDLSRQGTHCIRYFKISCLKKRIKKATQTNSGGDKWGKYILSDIIIRRPFVIVMESTFRLLWLHLALWFVENQTLTLSVCRNGTCWSLFMRVTETARTICYCFFLKYILAIVFMDIPFGHLESIYLP